MGFPEVSAILWRERELLEILLFKLEEEQLLLAAGRGRWLGQATREVEVVLEEIRRTEVLRAAEVEGLGRELGLGPSPSLRTLSDAAQEPWGEILGSHREAFLSLTETVTALAADNRDLLSAGRRVTYDALLSVGGVEDGAETYTATGATASAARRRLTVDEAI